MLASEPLVLVVPMPEITTNRRHGSSRHWRAIHAEKVAYWELLDLVSMGAHRVFSIPRPPAAPLERVTLTAHYVLRGAMDDDNAAARAKPLLDWLVRRRYIASDRRTCVRWAAFPTQHVTRKEPARITLTLTPLASDRPAA